MSSLFQKLKIPFILIALIFGGFIVYNNFVKTGPPTSTLLQKDKASATQTPEQSLLPLLLRIQSVTLDEKLFLDPVFRALVDFSQPIVPEVAGKVNPFAPTIFSNVNSAVEGLGFVDESSVATTTTPSTPTPTVPPKTTPAKTPSKTPIKR